MYNTIIVAMGYEDRLAAQALNVARKLRSEGGKIIAVHVIEPIPNIVRSYLPKDHDEETESSILEQIGREIESTRDAEATVLRGHPGATITEYAREVRADCIVVGSHEVAFSDYLLGSTAARIVRHAPCSVHVLR